MASSSASAETWVTFPTGAKMPVSWRADADRVEAYQRRLEAAHGLDPRPHCDCRVNGQALELAVVRRSVEGAARARYHLARMPNEGGLHRVGCAFHEADPDASGAAGYVKGVIDERPGGATLLRLGRSLQIAQAADAVASAVPAPQGARTGTATQRAMSPLGLLHFLWEKAGLTLWHPGFTGKRELWRVAHRLQEAAEAVTCGRTALQEQLAVVVPGSKRQASRLGEIVTASAGARYVVLVGVVHQADEGTGQITIRGTLPPYGLFLNCTPARTASLLRRHPYAARLLAAEPRSRGAEVVGLFIVRTTQTMWKGSPIIRAEVDLAALMETTRDFLPVASGLELQAADRLVTEQRHFSKPLRYDADTDLVFPDFVLLDTGQQQGWPMEVFGRTDEPYARRRAEKERHYNEHFGHAGWWSWQAAGAEAEPMPDFPPVARGVLP